MEYDENVQAMVSAGSGDVMEVALMIPMTDYAAALADRLRPDGTWTFAFGLRPWPEIRDGVPRTQEQIAAFVQESVEQEMREGRKRLVIVSRSDVVFYRLRRMVAEGAAIDVKVYLVRDDEQTRCDVNGYGILDPWPGELFGHVAHECGAILRAQRRQRATGAADTAKPTEGT